MIDLVASPHALMTSSPATPAAFVHSDSSPRPSLIPLVSFPSSSSPASASSTRTFFPASNPPPSFKPHPQRKKAPLTPIPARLLPSAASAANRENDASQANRAPPPARPTASPGAKRAPDERAEALRLLCQRSAAGENGRGEKRAAGRSDRQYSDDMLVLAQLPALLEGGQLAGVMDRVFRLLADSVENPRSKQASTALALLPSLLSSNVQAATACATMLLAALLHCYLHGEKFLQRDVPPLLHHCMALSAGRTVCFFSGKDRGASKNARDRAISACTLHAALSLCTASAFVAYDGCSSCPANLHARPAAAYSVSSLPSAEMTVVLGTLHAYMSDGQACTRYHARLALGLLCAHASPAALDVALKALPFEHAAAIKATAPTPPVSSPTFSPPSAGRPRHHTLPSPPPPPPSASPARAYAATLPDEREWEEWKQQPGLVSPVQTEPLLAEPAQGTPRRGLGEEHEDDDEVVVRVHNTRAAVSPVPFAAGDEDEEDEITVVEVVADESEQAMHTAISPHAAAAEAEAAVVVTVVQSVGEFPPLEQSGLQRIDSAEGAAVATQTAVPARIDSPLPLTPARSSGADTARLSIKRKRSDSPPPADADADKEQPLLHIASAAQLLQLCKQTEDGGSAHRRVVALGVAVAEWRAGDRQEVLQRRATEASIAAAERQAGRLTAMMERLMSSAELLRRTMRAEAAAVDSI